MNQDKQLRGNCQLCGRQQAYHNGRTAQHGYDVQHGYFNGVCHGARHQPIQMDRKVLDDMVETVRVDCADAEARADKIEAGKENPKELVTATYLPATNFRAERAEVRTPWAELQDWRREEWIRQACCQLRNHAKAGRDFADMMVALADKVHGQPLLEVARAAKPARVQKGDRKMGGQAGDEVLVALYQDGARVYWKNPRGFKGWDGVQAWRRRADAPAV